MAICREKATILVFVVVKLDVIHTCSCEELVTLVHLDAERVEHGFSLLRLLDDCILLLVLFTCRCRKHSKIMLEERIVCSELHHLRVDEDKLELSRMLCIQEGCDDHIESHRLTLLCSAGNKKVRCICKVKGLHLLGDGISDSDRKFRLAVSE